MGLWRSIIHGCLVKIDECGVLIVGESGSGKTTICLELAKRGHTFIADDAVEIERINGKVTGRSPDTIAGKVAIRGKGIAEIQRKADYGTHLDNVSINLVFNLSRSSRTELDYENMFGAIPNHSLQTINVMRSADFIEQIATTHGT